MIGKGRIRLNGRMRRDWACSSVSSDRDRADRGDSWQRDSRIASAETIWCGSIRTGFSVT